MFANAALRPLAGHCNRQRVYSALFYLIIVRNCNRLGKLAEISRFVHLSAMFRKVRRGHSKVSVALVTGASPLCATRRNASTVWVGESGWGGCGEWETATADRPVDRPPRLVPLRSARPSRHRLSLVVIASEAKQSSAARAAQDCRAASPLAMTRGRSAPALPWCRLPRIPTRHSREGGNPSPEGAYRAGMSWIPASAGMTSIGGVIKGWAATRPGPQPRRRCATATAMRRSRWPQIPSQRVRAGTSPRSWAASASMRARSAAERP